MSRQYHIPHVLLLVDTAGAFGRGIVEGIGRYAIEHGPWSVQFEYRALDSLPPEWLRQWRGDGIISRTVRLEQIKRLQATKRPLVELHGHPSVGIAQVRPDIEAGENAVVDHFVNCGLRNFAYFALGETWWVKINRESFAGVLAARGFTCHCYKPPISRAPMPAWREGQRPGLVQWLASLPRPIGIYTPGDLHAIRLMDICREVNVAMPGEMAIMGVGNDPVVCETVRPTLSSLDVNARRLGYEAAHLLDQMMAGIATKDEVLVPPSRVAVRQSTDLMAIPDADVAQAVYFIREFACKGVDVGRVANEVGLSRRALERRFRRYCGRAPKEELMRVRIEHAKMLLSRTDQTSESVAHRSGFASLVYFTKAFRREVGMTPYAYRKMQRISREPEELPAS